MWAGYYCLPPGLLCLQSCQVPSHNGVYTMYHGTSRQAAASIMNQGFRQSSDGMLGRGIYLSRDLQKASGYPLGLHDSQRAVLKVKVKVGKVKKIHYQGHPLQKSWHDHGYDTAWCPPNCGMVPSGQEEDCVWDPRRIVIIDVIYPNMGTGGGYVAPMGGYVAPMGGYGAPMGGFGAPMGGFGAPMGGFGAAMGWFGGYYC